MIAASAMPFCRARPIRGADHGDDRRFGSELISVDHVLNLVSSKIAVTARSNAFAGEIVHRGDVGTGEQHVLEFDRREEDHFGGGAARRRRGDGAGNRGVVNGAVEQCRSG